MESISKVEVQLPTPPPYFLPDESQSWRDVSSYHVQSPFSPIPPPGSFTFSPGLGSSTQTNSSLPVDLLTLTTPKVKFVSYVRLYRTPGLTKCLHCQTQVTTQVTYRVGTYAWLIFLVFVFCGLLLGCCLIPFFVNHFKDAHHTCPLCQRVIHIHEKRCCE